MKETAGIDILSSRNSNFSKIVADIAAMTPGQPIFKPIRTQTISIAKDPSQALVLLLY